MLTYDKCKELKDVGFPIQTVLDPDNTCGDFYVIEEKYVIIPTLSELIEACGDSFGGLHPFRKSGDFMGTPPIDKWLAESYMRGGLDAIGLTPEEAVCNLWLALNKK